MLRRPTATWRRKLSTMYPAPTQWSSTVGVRRPRRMMVMDRRRLSVLGNRSRIATTFLERSKWKFARLTFIGIARSSLTSSPFLWKNKTAISSPKKICELEMKTRPKKAKKYSYTKDCQEQPREICDQCEKKSIQPQCTMQERLTCEYEPVEQCQQEEKQYCHKVERVVVEEVCDMKFDTAYL